MAIRVLARAKINLALHVTGRRCDGYHLLDSVVAFADIGDAITVEAAETLTLTLTGPQAAPLSPSDNLVLTAARALHPTRGAHIILDKRLPVASGIGGGSADAAATLQALSQLWSLPLPGAASTLRLGADVPVCLYGQSARMQGIGEVLTPLTLPACWAVLANPGIAVATADIFRALTQRQNPALTAAPPLPDPHSLARWLGQQRNDLEPPAARIAPQITTTLTALRAQPGSLLARMSGSGATCYALFATQPQARAAARSLQTNHPAWWIQTTNLS